MNYRYDKEVTGKDFLKQSWRRLAREQSNFNPPQCGIPQLPLEEITKLQWHPEFADLMKNRMILGYFRYGSCADKKRNLGPEAIRRIVMYLESGNIEYLVDAANMCHMEWFKPAHPNAHFQSTDDGYHYEPHLKVKE